MQNNNKLLIAGLIIGCFFFAILAVVSFKNSEKKEIEFTGQKSALIKENLDLKTRADYIQNIVNQKLESIDAMDREKKELEKKLILLESDKERLAASFSEKLDVLKKKNFILKKKIVNLENMDIVQRIKQAIEKEDNENVKNVLEDTLSKVEMLKADKLVNLEPIIIKKESVDPPKSSSPQAEEETGGGTVLSVDGKNNLIVISLGRKDGVKEGSRCRILKDEKEIAFAEILSVRYRISAAFIDSFQAKFTIGDIKEGDKVVMIQK